MYSAISDLQIKHEIDVQQAYEAFRDTQTKLAAYAGGMHQILIALLQFVLTELERRVDFFCFNRATA